MGGVNDEVALAATIGFPELRVRRVPGVPFSREWCRRVEFIHVIQVSAHVVYSGECPVNCRIRAVQETQLSEERIAASTWAQRVFYLARLARTFECLSGHILLEWLKHGDRIGAAEAGILFAAVISLLVHDNLPVRQLLGVNERDLRDVSGLRGNLECVEEGAVLSLHENGNHKRHGQIHRWRVEGSDARAHVR